MEDSIKKLVDISRHFGTNPEYVIAGGGNTSYKNEDHIWVKASGSSLATITKDGFVKMNRMGLKRISTKIFDSNPLKREAEVMKELYSCVAENSGNRPSVETSLHNLLDFSFVVHTHPTLVNGLMCSKNCKKETQSIFGNEALLVEYADPGYILFKLVEKKLREYVDKNGKEPQIIFLENHGVFVAADTTIEIADIYNDISKKIRHKITHSIPSHVLKKFEPISLVEVLKKEKNLTAKLFTSDLINEFTKNQDAFKQVDTAFSPDNIVYCKAHYLYTKDDVQTLMKDCTDFEKKYGYWPKVVGIEKKGIICLEENETSLNRVYEIFLDILKISYYSRNFGGPRFMTPEQIEFIDTWEVENYRRKVGKECEGELGV